MQKILIFIFTVHMCKVTHSTETSDIYVIYNAYSGPEEQEGISSVEMHVQKNSLGKLFLLGNGTLRSPASTSQLCRSSSCEWRVINGTWKTSNLNVQELKALSLPLADMNFTCEYNNGGCQTICRNSLSGPLCSCPYEFSLNRDNRTCSSRISCHYLLNSDEGSFQSPNYPRNYPMNAMCSWLLVTSNNKQINLKIANLDSESSYDSVTVFDGINKEIGKWSGTGKTVTVASTGNIMLVVFQSDHSVTHRGFHAVYTTEERHTGISAKELESESGLMTSVLNISRSHLCLSLIYALAPSGSVNISAEQSTTGTTYFKQIHNTKINGWLIGRFVSDNYLDSMNNHTSVTIHLTGQQSKILSLVECTSEGEDVYILSDLIWKNHFLNVTQSFNDSALPHHSQKCNYGGTYDDIEGKCVCATGFIGPACEEACGPNRYGHNCSAVCSWFESGCRNMTFCSLSKHCECATGFSGTGCATECSLGTYGANCQNTCGNCKEGYCDIYTGECNAECAEGFYPPLCQERYIYLKDAPVLKARSWNEIEISINCTNTQGKGFPLLYEVQYKEILSSEWIKTPVQEINSRIVVLANLTNLKVGTRYLVRVVIISEDGNSYQGSNIPTAEVETLCQIPDTRTYCIESSNVTSSSFTIKWKYEVLSDKWCPVISYIVNLQEQWRIYSRKVSSTASKNYSLYSNLLPGHQYTTFVCAITRKGQAPCSFPFAVMTLDKAPGKVNQLTVESRNARDMHISWKKPIFTGGIVQRYHIEYECVRYFTCEDNCTDHIVHLKTTATSATLMDLLPHAQYKIRVAAYSASEGPYSNIFATTKTTSPSVSPIASDQPILSKTNTTVTVQWQQPQCPGINGYITGYYFILSSNTENDENILQNGTTKNTQTIFAALTPMTQYQVYVYVMNSHGWNSNYKLIIPFSSSATVPDAVEDLQVYKKGRRMIGIRWRKPARIYGTLKSFSVSFHQKDTERKFEKTVVPTPCSGWSHLFCHTINTNLLSDKQYIVSVRARNNEIDKDGMLSEVNTVTRENAPEAPSSLNIVRSTSTSFEMQWGLPYMFNGELRSFIINVEHIESLNDTECCEYFPVQELPFREESPFYNLEVSGLLPASTYIVSVSAKTITMGPSINATYCTAPLPPSLQAPQLIGVADDGHSYLVKIQPIKKHINPNSTYFLLVLPPGDTTLPIVWETELLNKLSERVNHSFYIVSQFKSNELTVEKEIKIGTGTEDRSGTLATLKDPKLTPGSYRLGLALVQIYGNSISVALATSNRFEAL